MIKRPGGKEVRAFLRRLLRAIRANWPKTEILLRADSHYCSPEVLDWCRANDLDYILGVAPTTTLRRGAETISTMACLLRRAFARLLGAGVRDARPPVGGRTWVRAQVTVGEAVGRRRGSCWRGIDEPPICR
jgi:hypothetical protein